MHCDVEGVHSLLGRAQKLCPGLGQWQLDDAWAGLRPTTTDGAPVRISASRRLQYDSYHVVGRFFVDFEPFRTAQVLGRTRWSNLWVCGGYWRNGILLAPTAAKLLADAMDASLSEADALLLDACRWDRFFAAVSSGSSRLREGHAGLTTGSPADLDRIGYGAIKTGESDAGGAARAANLDALFGKAPAPPAAAPAPTLGEGGYEAVRGVDGAASRKSNLELLFGEKALDLPEEDEVRQPSEHEDFPRAAPDEDGVILSMREVIGDGTYGPELVEGALPADLSGPTTKADGIQGLVDLPAPKVPLTGASEADDLYAQVARNKKS